jgi:hypothetical protein
MGWNFTHLYDSIIGGHCPRLISQKWILTELWAFIKLEKFYIIKSLLLLSNTETSRAGCLKDGSCYKMSLVWNISEDLTMAYHCFINLKNKLDDMYEYKHLELPVQPVNIINETSDYIYRKIYLWQDIRNIWSHRMLKLHLLRQRRNSSLSNNQRYYISLISLSSTCIINITILICQTYKFYICQA